MLGATPGTEEGEGQEHSGFYQELGEESEALSRVGKNLPANAEDMGLIPSLSGSHMLWGN